MGGAGRRLLSPSWTACGVGVHRNGERAVQEGRLVVVTRVALICVELWFVTRRPPLSVRTMNG